MACWMHLEGFQVVSSHLWALVCTGLTGRGHRSDRSECWSCSHVAHRSDWWSDRSDRSGLSCCNCPVSSGVLYAFIQGELHWFRGSIHVCRGSSLWFFEVWFGGLRFLFEHSLSRMCRAVALSYGVRDLSSSSDLLLAIVWLSITCWSFFLFVSFRFLFSLVTLCGCCQCTS
jgi:hypothetical protein